MIDRGFLRGLAISARGGGENHGGTFTMARRLKLWLRPHLRDEPPRLIGRVIEFNACPGSAARQQTDVARGIALHLLRKREGADEDAISFLACELIEARSVTDVRELVPGARAPRVAG